MIVLNKLLSLPQKARNFLSETQNLYVIRNSGLFDTDWYLSRNPDIAETKVDPVLHYLRSGGFEGRDPSPKFNSSWYLDTYQDVKQAGINPLSHYLRYGKKEGRLTQPPLYKCPVCQEGVHQFLPFPAHFMETARKYGYPFTADDAETLNTEQWLCPHCGASDRDRLCACYLDKIMPQQYTDDQIKLLDIAPSASLSKFIGEKENIACTTADLFMEGVDVSVDITNMPEVDSNSYDILICSHVLEHVNDDKKALSELYRVLKPGGWGIIMVPIILAIDEIDEDPQVTDVGERWRRFAQYDHVRLYSKAGFVKRVEDAGFSLKQLGVDYFGESVFKQIGITNKSVLYVAEKLDKIRS